MRSVAVVGSGAVGLYYGAHLLRGGCDVRFLLRSDFAAVRRQGIRIESGDQHWHFDDVRAYDAVDQIGVVDAVLVCLKATANNALAELLPPLVGPETLVLTLQNGLGNEEAIASIPVIRNIAGGVCFVCLNRIAPGHVRHLGAGAVEIGFFTSGISPRLVKVVNAFSAGGIECKNGGDLTSTRWRKLVWNIPFNGLTICHGGVPVGAVLSTRDGEATVRALMRETISAAAAYGVKIPSSFIEDQITLTRAMGDYQPSSLIDYLAGRPVELEAIWGEPLRRASAAGVETPQLRKLYESLRQLTSLAVPGQSLPGQARKLFSSAS